MSCREGDCGSQDKFSIKYFLRHKLYFYYGPMKVALELYNGGAKHLEWSHWCWKAGPCLVLQLTDGALAQILFVGWHDTVLTFHAYWNPSSIHDTDIHP